MDSTFAPWFTFDSTESGSILHVCYKFNGESHFKFVKRRFSGNVQLQIKNRNSGTQLLVEDRVFAMKHGWCTQAPEKLRMFSVHCTLGYLSSFRADEPFKMYEEFEIDIRMIRAVAVDIGSSWKAVPDVAKTFSFIGDGTASEVRRLCSISNN